MAFLQSDSIELALFLSAFISATLLPGGSEALLAGAVAAAPERAVMLTLTALLGNALGGMTGWLIGRLLPEKGQDARAVAWLRRWGAWALLLSWLPVAGDALPVAAGWLRIGPVRSFVFIALGKGLRYAAIAAAVLPLAG